MCPLPEQITSTEFKTHAKIPYPSPAALVTRFNSNPNDAEIEAGIQRIINSYSSQRAPTLATIKMVSVLASCCKKTIWHRLLETTCQKIVETRLSNINLCYGLGKMLMRAPKDQLSDMDFLGLLLILQPSLETLIDAKRTPIEVILVIDLLTLIVNCMIDSGFKGVGIHHPLLVFLTKFKAEITATDELQQKFRFLKNKVIYLQMLLAAFRSSAQMFDDKLKQIKYIGQGTLHCLSLGVDIAACVVCPPAIAGALPAMIINVTGVCHNFSKAAQVQIIYDQATRQYIEGLEHTAWSLRTAANATKYKDLLLTTARMNEFYEKKAKNTELMIIFKVVEIITNYLISTVRKKPYETKTFITELLNIIEIIMKKSREQGCRTRCLSAFISFSLRRVIVTTKSGYIKTKTQKIYNKLNNDKKFGFIHDKNPAAHITVSAEIEALALNYCSLTNAIDGTSLDELTFAWRNLTAPVRRGSIDLSTIT